MVRAHHGAPREFIGNIATQWGVIHENEARDEFCWSQGHIIQDASFYVHPKIDWLGASPDGLIGENGLIEIKCPFGLRDKEMPEFKKPEDQPHYVAQMQIQMFVTGRHVCYFWQWTPNATDLNIVMFNPKWIDENFPALEAFYREYLVNRDSPEDYLEEARKIVDTSRALQMVAEYDDLKTAIEQAEERKKELLEEMVLISKGQNAIFGGRKLTKVDRAGSISYAKAIKHLAPDANLEPWRGKGSSSWTLK